MPEFLEAANYTPASRDRAHVWYLVIHDEETPQKPHEAHLIAESFHNQERSSRGTSAHRVADNREIVRCVHWQDIAWAAPGANTNGLHWEQSGYVRDKKEKWTDPYGEAQMHLLARDVAAFASLSGIKPVRLEPEQLRLNAKHGQGLHRGICGHDTVTAAFPNEGTHTDPGARYPWDEFISRVRHYMHK